MYDVPDTSGLPYQNLGGPNHEGYVTVTAAQAAFAQSIADAVVPEPAPAVLLLVLVGLGIARRPRACPVRASR
jgi:hypothetical protein